MKKLLLLFTLVFTFSIAKSQCHYIVDMQDSYGDGWNGASINVSINGAVVGNFTVPLGQDLMQLILLAPILVITLVLILFQVLGIQKLLLPLLLLMEVV